MERRYQGVYPVVFTPLKQDGAVDVPALQRLVEHGLLEVEEIERLRDPFAEIAVREHHAVDLIPAQQEAVTQVVQAL